ncbi:MAG: ATP-binding cassette domain-containing protein [Caldilineae bacterium]|nr:MAG: ATP-binding cassette domain-containing protein [Caldilineae bacterium]
MSNPILIADGLRKQYGDIHAVRRLDLQIARGEIFGLLGPNGAGKTTTIAMLAGLLAPDGGKILLDGQPLTPDARGLKARIGLVPQELALYPTLSARDNLLFFGRIYGLRGKLLRRRIESVLETVGLTERARDPIETYSGGMKRRINIAASLLHEPDLLFLDEPTVGVDPQSRNAIFESVEALNRAGMTILYTTHYMEEAQRLCHRLAIMDGGRVIALDTPQALIRRLGGGVIRLRLDDGLMPRLAEHAAHLPAVKTVSRHDGQLFIEAERPQEALVALLEVSNRLDARITALQILEPNLETVFLQLTGKTLRD